MHAPLSVILFTVLSGAGFGFVALFVLADLFAIGGPVERGELLVAALLGLLIITAGLLLSTGHLTKPRDGWRALARVRSSWLSREAVCAGLFFPVAALYLLPYLMGGVEHTAWTAFWALLTALLAVATVVTTGMIYGCVRAVHDWQQSLTPVNFVLIGLGSGAVLLTVVRAGAGADPAPIAALGATLLAVAAASKAAWFSWRHRPAGSTPATATGLTQGVVRLHDSGHSGPTFLDHELQSDQIAKRHPAVAYYRWLVVGAGLALPALLLAAVAAGAGTLWAVLALALVGGGAVLERWLFFAEARHTIRLYY
ncbi:hypothetical protein CKO15_09400 [Halorhodospira abdelmalekii]|uniref:dimethyl sulfoxide reductase anchor subunit family protein n=1 Tax=Halorhodospira abdelmalekii TaxID=421629 RepID=UPI001908721A|nr:DmsC/YnfH family molybdoenzyme membrane anchor subunit [Halorhodospira abdelmalekii]MBK1735494.1 hypothetical protein [Halorhodospira abdelmalekii]